MPDAMALLPCWSADTAPLGSNCTGAKATESPAAAGRLAPATIKAEADPARADKIAQGPRILSIIDKVTFSRWPGGRVPIGRPIWQFPLARNAQTESAASAP